MNAKPDEATRRLVHHDENPMGSTGCRFASEQVAAPQAVLRVAKKGEPGGTTPVRFRTVVNAQNTANHVLVNFNPESQNDLLSDARTAQRGFRRFNSTTASMSSLAGPLGPGRRRRVGENSSRYFRLISTRWRCNNVDGLSPMAERRSRARQMKSVHTAAMKRSATRKLGARWRPRFKMSS